MNNPADLEGWVDDDACASENAHEENLNLSKLVIAQNKKKAKSGGFQMLGLSRPVLQGVLHKGYKIPTPIQRRVIPLILEGKDVVAMARTGSGKTASFLIPLFEKLKFHSLRIGARAIILSPTRELALQTLTFAKELGKYTGLKAATILGGESMDSQFAAMHANPDIIIATPGRFTHICIEMNLKLDTVEYVVFDEADRLFEMGFQEQMNDLLSRLSSNRQTVLFSATLPKMLVEFARAGLSDPTLIRLDVETKLSDNLKLGFFKVSSEDKLSLLIHLLENVIHSSEPTVIFVPTRHHVEYFYVLLTTSGFSATYVYSALDPSARKINIAKFRARKVNLLIVTDIAARGIDIPLLDNVINFNFPPKPKLFIHRVGRVARAGRSGTAYSFVSSYEMSYLLDLHMFLSRSIKLCPVIGENTDSTENPGREEDWDRLFGRVPQDIISENEDFIIKKLEKSYDLKNLKKSADNGYEKYRKTCLPVTRETHRRLKDELWGADIGYHPLFKDYTQSSLQQKRLDMLEKLKNVRPKMTVFELNCKNAKGQDSTCFMQKKRLLDDEKIENFHNNLQRKKLKAEELNKKQRKAEEMASQLVESSEAEVRTTFNKVIGKSKNKKGKSTTGANCEPLGTPSVAETNENSFIPYAPADHFEEQGYSIMSNFERDTANATFELIGEDGQSGNREKPRIKWDRKTMKFKGQNQEKKIKTESGVWVPATYKKDLYEKWKLKTQPKDTVVDEEEDECGGEDKRDWRGKGKKNFNKNEKKGFVSLTDSGLHHKRHPLLNGKQTEKTVYTKKGGPRQARSYQVRVKVVKEKRKLFKFFKERQEINAKKRQKHGTRK